MASKLSPPDILDLHLKGVPVSKIAKEAGTSTQYIYQIINSNDKTRIATHKKGRPRKKPPEPPAESSDAVKDIIEKRIKERTLPAVAENNDPSALEMREMLGSILKWYKMPPIESDEECAERLEAFFDSLAKTGELPSVEKMALALGVTRQAVWQWENGMKCSAERTEMIKRAKEILAAMDAELVSRNKIPQVTYIFRAKNFFGMKDQTDVVVTPNNPIGALVSEDELRKRITGDVVVDDTIDAEFRE